MKKRLRVVIGDDTPAMLEAVKQLLQDRCHVLAALESGRAVVDQVPSLNPDVLVLDISMGEMNGLEIARRLKSNHCRSKIVFLSVHEEPEIIRAALALGASGYVFKSRMHTDLNTAIRRALSHKVFVPAAPVAESGSATA